MAALLVVSGNPAVAAGGQPDSRNPRNSPLTSVAVSAQNQVGVMMRFHLIENVRGVREQQRKPMLRLCW